MVETRKTTPAINNNLLPQKRYQTLKENSGDFISVDNQGMKRTGSQNTMVTLHASEVPEMKHEIYREYPPRPGTPDMDSFMPSFDDVPVLLRKNNSKL